MTPSERKICSDNVLKTSQLYGNDNVGCTATNKIDNDINVAIKNNDEADCNQCEHLNLTEQEQSQTKEPHICQFYNTRVLHNAHRQPHNSKLFPCIECVKDTYKEYKPKYILRRNRNDKR